MPAPAASGGESLCLYNIKNLLANCATVQTFLGAANAAAALALIAGDHVTAMGLPSVRVVMGDDYEPREIAINTWSESGSATAVFRITPSVSYTTREEWEAWGRNIRGNVIDECRALIGGGGGYIRARSIRADSPIMFGEREAAATEAANYMQWAISFRFSTEDGG